MFLVFLAFHLLIISVQTRKYEFYGSWNANTTQCYLSFPYSSNCASWRVMAIVVLRNTSQLPSTMNSIRSFLVGVTSKCDSQSELLYFAPGLQNRQCGHVQMPFGIETLESDYPDSAAGVDSKDEVSTFKEVYSISEECALMHSLGDEQGGALFIFTDLNSSQAESLKLSISSFLQNRYLARFMILNSNQTKDEYKNSFANCIYPLCDYGIYNDSSLGDCIDDMQTCEVEKKSPVLGMAALVTVIVIPIVCVTAIVIACLYFFYKNPQRLQRIKVFASQNSSVHKNDYSMQPYRIPPTYDAKFCPNGPDLWEVERNDLLIDESILLGNGAFARVVKGSLTGRIPLMEATSNLNLAIENMKDGLCEVAVKRLPGYADTEAVIDFRQEIEFMKQLGYHSHVINLIGCVSCAIDPLILVEFCHHGDLLRFLRKHKQHVLQPDEDCPIDAELCLRVKDLVSFAWQISDGMSYLASKGYVHRDLAARNVLINKKLVAKISDFGLCRYVDSALYTAKGGRLPIKWMSIESLKRYEFSEKSDVWSFSILLFELFSLGDSPFPLIQPLEMIKYLEEGYRMEQPTICPNEVYNLMRKCWQEDPDLRPKFDQLRSDLTIMLNMEDEHYGYIQLNQPESRSIKSMMRRQVSDFPDNSHLQTSTSTLNDLSDTTSSNSGEFERKVQIDSDFDDYYSTTSRFNSVWNLRKSTMGKVAEEDEISDTSTVVNIPNISPQTDENDISDGSLNICSTTQIQRTTKESTCPLSTGGLELTDVIFTCDSYR